MDSEYEDYNLDRMLKELSYDTPSDNVCNIYAICRDNEDALKHFIEINCNTPIYNKVYKYYAEIVGYNYDNNKIPIIIVGITKKDENFHHSIWNEFSGEDVVIAKDLDKFIGYKYVIMYDIINAIESRNNQFILDF